MSIVYILVGPPCSGKSTLAKRVVSETSGMIRVNRDELRTMLKGKYMVGGRIEEIVTQLVQITIVDAVVSSMDIIVDATHCKVKYINDIKKMIPEGLNVKFQYIVCDIPYWKQRWRNFWRYLYTGIWIPSKVSKSMHNNFQETKQAIKEGRV